MTTIIQDLKKLSREMQEWATKHQEGKRIALYAEIDKLCFEHSGAWVTKIKRAVATFLGTSIDEASLGLTSLSHSDFPSLREALEKIINAYTAWNRIVHGAGDLCEFITWHMIDDARKTLSSPEAQPGIEWKLLCARNQALENVLREMIDKVLWGRDSEVVERARALLAGRPKPREFDENDMFKTEASKP